MHIESRSGHYTHRSFFYSEVYEHYNECLEMGHRRTLHDASILCKVTQTAVTLRTGDHSFPRIEAQIFGAGDECPYPEQPNAIELT
jgi:hypothetical protein